MNNLPPDQNFGLNELGQDTDNAGTPSSTGSIAGYLRAIRDLIASDGVTTGTGVYSTSAAPTYDNDSPNSFSSDLAGNLRTVEKNSAAILAALSGFTYSHLSGAGTTLVKSGAGELHIVNVNTKGTVASTIKVYDGLDDTGTLIATIDSLNLSGPFQFDINFATGLTVVMTGTLGPDATVSYR